VGKDESLGDAVSSIGDFNGDGVDDVVLGLNAGSIYDGHSYYYIIYGKEGGYEDNIIDIKNFPIS
jgi:hypothetical protein